MHALVVLFVRDDSVYKRMGLDCYDAKRDARTWPGGCPAICHPPCRGWGQLAHMSNADDAERALAVWAVEQVRRWGGVLEHPSASRLWAACSLPRPGAGRDSAGGFSLAVEQHWWGHRARKRTLLYVCGCEPADVPVMPLTLTDPPCIVGTPGRRRDGSRLRPGDARYKPETSKTEREATPPAFAAWLVELARKCSKHNTMLVGTGKGV
jgi:hypothetical protein